MFLQYENQTRADGQAVRAWHTQMSLRKIECSCSLCAK